MLGSQLPEQMHRKLLCKRNQFEAENTLNLHYRAIRKLLCKRNQFEADKHQQISKIQD